MVKLLKKLFNNRKGTAEVIGSIMFIVILLFFFTNVYLWHDAATKEMNDLQLKKMNAGMDLNYIEGTLTVTARGSDVVLSRLWIDESDNHFYADLEGLNVQMLAGKTVTITFSGSPSFNDGAINAELSGSDNILVHYYVPTNAKLSVLNTLGISVVTST